MRSVQRPKRGGVVRNEANDGLRNMDFVRRDPGCHGRGRRGPGRKPRATEREYLKAMAQCVGVEDWRRVVRKAKEQALTGDSRAQEWLARYLLGTRPESLGEVLGVVPRALIE